MLSVAVAAFLIAPQQLKLAPGAVIVRSGKVTGKSLRSPAGLTIGRDGIVVDFNGLRITSGATDQAAYEGAGILLKNRRNVVIKNARVSGFRYNIQLINCSNIRLENCQVDRSRAIRIATPEGRVIDNFLNIRDSETWRTYGAGIWMENSHLCRIHDCQASEAQNGLLMIGSNENTVDACDFSFNSGWGIGLASSSRNQILWNRADFVNRPWGGGWGGDASGFAVADGSNDNFFVGNSFTHGGDGFFLTDKVNGGYDPASKTFKFQGSSNNNLIAHNDGSWSPANAFEGTFSFGNIYVRNLANDSGYGFWLGFSSDSLVARNDIMRNRADAIAIEQGSNNHLELNDIANTGGIAVHLWQGTAPEHMTRPSTNNVIAGNRIAAAAAAYSLENSTATRVRDNTIENAPLARNWEIDSATGDLATTAFLNSDKYARMQRMLAMRPKGYLYYRESGMPQGLKWVEAGEFAPRDFRNDIVAYRRVNESELEIEGVRRVPYRIALASNVEMIPAPGNRAAYYVRPKLAEGAVGGFIDPQLVVTQAGRKQRIPATLFAADWLVKWWNWDRNKLTPEWSSGWEALFQSSPLVERHQRQIAGDFSFKSQAPGINTEYFAFEGVTRVQLAAGTYEFTALPDDGLQVFFDGKPLIDAWKPTPGDLSGRVDASEGVHEIKVRFMQTWGHTYLRLAFRRLA